MSADERSVIRTARGTTGTSPHEAGDAAPILTDPSLYINRELSWLAFNDRVLDQARGTSHPLLERVKFLAIAANNLDEFSMIRLATLVRQARSPLAPPSPDGLTPAQQLVAVRARAVQMLRDIADCWTDLLQPLLSGNAIRFLEPHDYDDQVSAYLRSYFTAQVCPVLTPLAFDPGHPFPYISNRSKSLAVAVEHEGRTKFARVKLPDPLPRFIPIPAAITRRPGHCFAFLEDVVRLNLDELFPGVKIESAHLFRIIRDTDIVLAEEESEDLLETVDQSLRQMRHGALSLLEVESAMPARVLEILVENFEVSEDVVVRSSDRMAFADWMALSRLPRPTLKDPPFTPRPLWTARDRDTVFEEIRYRDHLLHHPFDSFTSVETFLEAAVQDPNVVGIKMTLYRIGANSPLIDQLIAAAEGGTQVAVLVELKARFDERSNIEWATRLEEAGVHVVYGLMNLKTHCKLCLVVRKEADGVHRYVHVGTGNYNRTTAQVYTDVGLFTTNPRIVADVSELFNYLTGYSSQTSYRELLVAPLGLRQRLVELIEREAAHARAGRPARLIFKTNAVSDPEMIATLYRASQAGVQMDLLVRGICCLRPGIPGISKTIQVRSIVGRFLEHSRIYYFANAGDEELYVGSADLMERNLNRRVETLCPILVPELRRNIRDNILAPYLRDNVRATVLTPDGAYEPVPTESGDVTFDAQQWLLDTAPPDTSITSTGR